MARDLHPDSSVDDARRITALHARTAILLGVDFLPVSLSVTGQAAAGGTPAPPVHSEPAPATRPSPVTPPMAEAPARASGDADDAERAARQALLDALRARHDESCPHCTKATAHTRTVFGEGDPCARLMFIGEAPGAEEDRTGRPFVGRAGQKLDEMIRAMGLSRERVYIANVLKARPLDNATPTPEEAMRCGPFLREQVAIIRPVVIVALGKPASQFLLDSRDSMSSLRGRWASYDAGGHTAAVMPTFHPAYLLRAYTPENREKVWSDLKQAMAKLAAAPGA